MTSIEVASLTPHIGAEVSGVDLAKPLSNVRWNATSAARSGLVGARFSRSDQLTQRSTKRSPRRFGPLHVHPLKACAGYDDHGDPAILAVKTTQKSKFTAGDAWHTDVSCDEKPPMGSMLYMKQTPVGRRRRYACSPTCIAPSRRCQSRCSGFWRRLTGATRDELEPESEVQTFTHVRRQPKLHPTAPCHNPPPLRV